MSLYDDIDSGLDANKSERVPGWGSSNMKLLESQMKLRKAAISQPRRDLTRRAATMAPVIDLKGKREDEESPVAAAALALSAQLGQRSAARAAGQLISFGPDADTRNEYDPLKPNDYDKIVKEMRRKKEEERARERREKEAAAVPRRGLVGNYSDDDDDDDEEEVAKEEERKRKGALGAAIAPPSVLQERSSSPPLRLGLGGGGGGGPGSIAAKIMAKYGYREGQGLGKAGQGISRALAVEKTSKRGGRIIHDREQGVPPEAMMPPPAGPPPPEPEPEPAALLADLMPPPPPPAEPTMAEILRNPTKVVMLRNMVGAGEVDEELEGEVKEECTAKYGDVIKVTIMEASGGADTEAVRIFVEFKRIENAIKALVDLNGRFFGGRQVKARFYEQDRYDDLELNLHVP